MNILKGILAESKAHYVSSKKKIEGKLRKLPMGSIKERRISGRKYYYLQYRKGRKVVHKYLGRKKPEEILQQIRERRRLKAELKKVDDALRIFWKIESVV